MKKSTITFSTNMSANDKGVVLAVLGFHDVQSHDKYLISLQYLVEINTTLLKILKGVFGRKENEKENEETGNFLTFGSF